MFKTIKYAYNLKRKDLSFKKTRKRENKTFK